MAIIAVMDLSMLVEEIDAEIHRHGAGQSSSDWQDRATQTWCAASGAEGGKLRIACADGGSSKEALGEVSRTVETPTLTPGRKKPARISFQSVTYSLCARM
jgi:hypothetical protein